MNQKETKFAFFGTPEMAVTALEELKSFGYLPSLIVCNPDAPVGRKQILTPPPTKVWAKMNNIPVFQPTSLKTYAELTPLTEATWDFFVVLAYGKLLPEKILGLPKYKTINAHPSLLPKLRGASPIRSALLTDLSAVGVTIMQLDKELDHGPILMQQPVALYGVPVLGRVLDENLAHICGCLLADVMDKLPQGLITKTEQDHSKATFCTKITKEMAEVNINPHALPQGAEALSVYSKICAFDGWPTAFFIHNDKRIKITRAELTDNTLHILRVIPEGKNEMDFEVFLKSI